MNTKLITYLTLSLSISLFNTTSSATGIIPNDGPSSIRTIGLIAATGGVAALAHKNGSSFWGIVLLSAGTVAAVGANRVAEEVNRHMLQQGFFNRLWRDAKNACSKIEEKLEE